MNNCKNCGNAIYDGRWGDYKCYLKHRNCSPSEVKDGCPEWSETRAVKVVEKEVRKNGATFRPSVADDGTLSWTNDQNLKNPNPVNIMGPKGDPGDPGEPGKDGERGEKGDAFEYSDFTSEQLANLKGPKGDPGEPGKDGKDGQPGRDGLDGQPGKDGEKGEKGEPGEPGAAGKDGKDGEDGQPGKDGVSPTVEVSDISGGHKVTVTDVNGAKEFNVLDGKDGKDGEGGSGGAAIIDVTELPTENIDEQAFYRLLTGSFVYNQYNQSGWVCYCVESLPEVGELVSVDMKNVTAYYNFSDGVAYGYLNDMLGAGVGVPAGWYPLEMLAPAFNITYNGVINDISEDPRDNSFRLLLEYVNYSYKGGWISHKVLGWPGTGNGAEIFNHPANKAYGSVSHAEGRFTTAGVEGVESYGAHAEGWNTQALADASHAEGSYTTASGDYSHVEGHETTASGSYSHAEGCGTEASGVGSHTEGWKTTASGYYSHAEGYNTTASDSSSHAEGYKTTASGYYSHAEGCGTEASGANQHVQGKFNVEDTVNKYAHIVGNGDHDDARSNAHTLDWSGNAWYAGNVEGTALILKSPDGSRFNITVSNDGNLTVTKL